jgi:NAD+ synthase
MRQMNPEKETKRIIQFIKDTFKGKEFSNAVIGVSGGIDSAVVTCLLAQALGKENVYGWSLPYGEQFDIKDAELVAKEYGINYETINIKPVVDSFLEALAYDKEDRISEGNIKARTRMILLYDMSAFHKALVAGTSNRTELALGYFTLYGDGACALEPIGHLFKTEVFQLARYLKIPEQIINKAPSAGLWKGQTDEQELGYSYETIDNFLDKMDSGRGICDWTDTEKDILSRIIKNSFKLESPKILGEN